MYDRPDPGLKIKVKTNRDPDSGDVTEVKGICSRGGGWYEEGCDLMVVLKRCKNSRRVAERQKIVLEKRRHKSKLEMA